MKLIAKRFLAGLMAICTLPAWCDTIPAHDCRRDLEDLPGFMLENDAGGKDLYERYGAAHFDSALAAARESVATIQADEECAPILEKYLTAWRRTHLFITAQHPTPSATTGAAGATEEDRLPTMRVLSRKTLLLTLRSFNGKTREPLIAMLKSKRHEFESHPNWIIDVRDNNGGQDSSYAPLVPWLLDNGRVDVNTRIYVTPANIAGWEHICEQEAPGDSSCMKSAATMIPRMKAAKTGEYIGLNDGDDGIYYSSADTSIKHRPSRVAILTDEACGSSCEQFLLAARESFSVKLIGRHTWGGLDYSNLRGHDLPSGKWRLFYATTRSLRIPNLPVDGIGVLPDIYLPDSHSATAAADEIERTRRWLEGGTLAPLDAKSK